MTGSMINRKSIHPTPTKERISGEPTAMTELKRTVRNGASNFYWIAGLSAAYTIFYFFGARFSVVIGLGITQFMDIIALDIAHLYPNSDILIRSSGVILNIFVAGMFAVFGYFATKGKQWAFITGMVLYGLDTILMFVEQDFVGLVFHLFFLWYLYLGLQSINRLNKIVPEITASPIHKDDGH
jgi:hypothetical protein